MKKSEIKFHITQTHGFEIVRSADKAVYIAYKRTGKFRAEYVVALCSENDTPNAKDGLGALLGRIEFTKPMPCVITCDCDMAMVMRDMAEDAAYIRRTNRFF